MYCQSCGSQVEAGNKFCESCGEGIEVEVQTNVESSNRKDKVTDSLNMLREKINMRIKQKNNRISQMLNRLFLFVYESIFIFIRTTV